MSFLIRQTLIYAVPLMIVALAGIFAERSGIINLALEGIMIFGAFIGVLFVRLVQQWGWFDAAMAAKDWPALQGFMVLAMAVAALFGALFSLLLAFAASYTSRVLFIRDGKIFTELRRGDTDRREFFDRIMEVVAMMGGEGSDAL